MSFAPSFLYIQRELLLAESLLADGLTRVRKGSSATAGDLARGFFGLATGVERVLKIIYVVDHMGSNQLEAPSNSDLRDFGHDIESLYRAVSDLPAADGMCAFPEEGSIDLELLKFLSDFGRGARYHNLDALSGSARNADPFATWQEILGRVLESDVRPSNRARVESTGAAIAERLASVTSSFLHDLDGKPMSVAAALTQPQLQRLASRHVVARLFGLLRPLKLVLNELRTVTYTVSREHGDGSMAVPDFADMLVFLLSDRATVLSRKQWP